MKNYCKIKLTETNLYTSYKEDTVEMCILGNFLTSDVGSWWSSYKEWALNDSITGGGGNTSSLEKEGDYIIMTDEYSEPEYADIALKIKKEEFINILNEWEKIRKLRPKEITITHVGEKFIFEY